MKNFQEGIDNLVTKILMRRLMLKLNKIMENKGEWEEELHGGQSKIDVAEPKGKITAADFKKLRDAKSHKKEVEEYSLMMRKSKMLRNYLKMNQLMLVWVLKIITS